MIQDSRFKVSDVGFRVSWLGKGGCLAGVWFSFRLLLGLGVDKYIIKKACSLELELSFLFTSRSEKYGGGV